MKEKIDLTGRCKESFEKWYLNKYESRKDLPIEFGFFARIALDSFYIKEFEFKFGVYMIFFDENNIFSCVNRAYDQDMKNFSYYSFTYHHQNRFDSPDIIELNTLMDAMKTAIEESNDIYNEMWTL